MSARRYPDEDFDDHVDRVTADERQRELDERVEAAAMQDAFMEGQRAGMHGLAAGLNPYADIKCPEHAEWNRGRLAALGSRLGRAA